MNLLQFLQLHASKLIAMVSSENGERAAVQVAVPVEHCFTVLRDRLDRLEARSGLFIGCGTGHEVVYLRRRFRSRRIFGLDVASDFSPLARQEACVLVADAKRLPFPPQTFDFATAIHSLEHLGEPKAALAEVARVLKPGGWFYVGAPNKTRIIGYLGSPDATTREKFVWNAIDWGKRLRGRFENRLGGHAGFTSRELLGLLEPDFSASQLLTAEYLRFKYGRRLPRLLLEPLLTPGIIQYAAPSHYILSRKKS